MTGEGIERIHQLSAAEALTSLRAATNGLSAAEAGRRLASFGPNSIERRERESWLRKLLKNFTQFFALILWLASGLAFFAESREPGMGMATLGFAIIGVILINGLFSFWQEFRAERALVALQKLLPKQVKVLRNGRMELLPAQMLVPGDVIALEAGDEIPADCRLIEAFDVRVNNATITGESVPQVRDAEASRESELVAARNILLAGTALVSGEARALVFATGAHSLFGQIAHLTQSVNLSISPLLQEIHRLSRLIAVLALLLGLVFFLIGQSMGLSFWSNVLFAVGIIVANVPEGLLPTVTLALAMGARRLAARNALIRHLPAVETLGEVTVICSDKTGTLTENRLSVQQVFAAGQWHTATNEQEISALARAFPLLFSVASACHSLERVEGKMFGDPLETALYDFASGAGVAEAGTRLAIFPFDSEKRRLSTLQHHADGLMLYSKGALEALLPLCTAVLGGNGEQQLDETVRQSLLAAQEQMAENGLRVLALACRPVAQNGTRDELERDLLLLGLVALQDPPRAEVPHAVEMCRRAGIRVIMVTGDHPGTARAIAGQIGMLPEGNGRVVLGEELSHLTDTQLQFVLEEPALVFARVTAQQKLRIVQALKHKGETVAVTGDGVNDAPALKYADIGVAMGRSGTDVAREAADMVLLDDNFATIVNAVEEGRAVYANIRKFLTYILTSNIPEIVPYLAFVLCKIPLPLTVIQILAVDLGTDMLPALGLGAEPPGPTVMHEPPRRKTERLLDTALLLRAYGFLGVLEAAASLAAFFMVLYAGGWKPGMELAHDNTLYMAATTACFAAIVVAQVANVFICRDARLGVAQLPLFNNRVIFAGIAVELSLLGLIVFTPQGNSLFGTAIFPASVWLWIGAFAVAMLLLEEVRKAIQRRRAAWKQS